MAMMTTVHDCKHGHQARSCYICELEGQVAEDTLTIIGLRALLEEWVGPVRDQRPDLLDRTERAIEWR